MSTTSCVKRQREQHRSLRGPKHTPEIRAKICRIKAEDGLTNRELAERFGICPHTVGRILRGDW